MERKMADDRASHSANPKDVTFVDEVWSKDGGDGGEPLLARVYFPPDDDTTGSPPRRRPAVLDVHGGAWSSKDRTLDEVSNRALAAAGFVVAAVDFRQGPTHKHPAASLDVASALAWLRTTGAERWDVDCERVGILGTSSGGHLAMHVSVDPHITCPDDKKVGPPPLASEGNNAAAAEGNKRRRLKDPAVVRPPRFVVALWPVSDPLARYRYAKRAKLLHLVEAQDGYFETEGNMREASVPRIVTAGSGSVPAGGGGGGEEYPLPPLLVVQPGEDSNIPPEITFDLMRSWQGRDGYLEYAFFPGEPHAFGLRDGPATRRMNDIVVDFARRHSS